MHGHGLLFHNYDLPNYFQLTIGGQSRRLNYSSNRDQDILADYLKHDKPTRIECDKVRVSSDYPFLPQDAFSKAMLRDGSNVILALRWRDYLGLACYVRVFAEQSQGFGKPGFG